MSSKITVLVPGLFLLAALAACGSVATTSPASTPPAQGSSPASPADTGQPPAARAAATELPSDFEISLYRGQEVLGATELQFSGLFGQGKPVVLNFFAGLCPPCRAEMPDIQLVSSQYQDRVAIFELNIGPFVALGSREDGKALVKELGITYPTGTTRDREVVRVYQVLGMPNCCCHAP